MFSRGNAYTTSQLYEEQFGKLSQDSKIELAKIKKKATKLSKEDIKIDRRFKKYVIKISTAKVYVKVTAKVYVVKNPQTL